MRGIVLAVFAAGALVAGGCATRGPLSENPLYIGPVTGCMPNPVLLLPDAPGPEAYDTVFSKVYSIITDYFPEIADSNRYSGRIETKPRIAPGFEQPWKPGSPDHSERLLATLQSIRHRCLVTIQPGAGEQGGYLVMVMIYKELEDVRSGPTRQLALPIFRDAATVERQFEVIDMTVIDSFWIPKGRDTAFEQEILRRIGSCLQTR
jgi:hypothetical protein